MLDQLPILSDDLLAQIADLAKILYPDPDDQDIAVVCITLGVQIALAAVVLKKKDEIHG